MSAFPDSETHVPTLYASGLSRVQFAGLSTTLAVLGISTVWPTVVSLWTMWTTDGIKSIGMVIPLVSLILILRVWRSLGWEMEGSWWGLPILLVTMVAGRVQADANLVLVFSPQMSRVFPPAALVVLAYGAGIVLLFGGTRLFRAALFPILLLWFVNPIPHIFNLLVDLPLQRASAHIARAFAMDMGHSLTPDHLRLMFTPDFGMFIAPGCNGVRGSVTMGFIALIAGYLYRFRWYANGLVVMAAILLGYLFNLIRLCLLVVYYVVALHFTSLQDKAENADYLIGAALFLVATLLLFAAIHRLREASNPTVPQVSEVIPDESLGDAPRFRYARLAAMGGVVLLGLAGVARSESTIHSSATRAAGLEAKQFPQHIGSYTLVRTWNETLSTGPVVYVWAQYAPVNGGRSVAIGVSPVLGWHDPLICHSIRGENPLWQGELTVGTADVASTRFSSAFYNDGVSQYLEASTQCDGRSCGEFASERTHFGFVYSRPDPKSFLSDDPHRPIRVLLRAEMLDLVVSADTARVGLTQDLRAFLASVRLDDLTRQ